MSLSKYKSLLLVFALLSGCTTTQMERSDFQDTTFSAVTYDRGLDEQDSTLRSLEGLSSETHVQSAVRRDFYLPSSYLKGLKKRAVEARRSLASQSRADAAELRVLSVEALVNERPEQVQGFILYAKSKKARRNLMAEDQLLLGLAAMMMSDVGAAKEMLIQAMTADSQLSATVRANLGLIAMKNGLFLESFDHLSQAHAIEPKNKSLMHLLAESAHSARKHAVAVATYEKIIALSPRDFLAHYNLGLVYHYGLRKYSAARREFQFILDHPRSSREIRILADGAAANVRREEEGIQGIATTGFQ
jgi:tetratricopeptide (TPR) repeat protein